MNNNELISNKNSSSKRELINDNHHVMISKEEDDIARFRNFIFSINAKSNSRTISYQYNVDIKKNNIIALNNSIVNKVRVHFDEKTDLILSSATIVTEDKKSYSYTTWDSILVGLREMENCNEPIATLTLVWLLSIKLPQYTVPQEQMLTVKVSNKMKPQDLIQLFFSGKLDSSDEMELDLHPLMCKIDYTDSVLADDLLSIVSKWFEGIKDEDQVSRYILEIRKHRKKIAYILNNLPVIISLFYIYNTAKNILLTIDNPISVIMVSDLIPAINFTLICIIIVIIVYRVATIIANKLFFILEGYVESHAFNISIGDKKRIKAYKKQRVSKNRTLLYNFFCAIANSILGAFISALISKLF